MNFWNQRAFTPRVMPGNQFNNVAQPPRRFPWGQFAGKQQNPYRLPWERPNMPDWAQGRREEAGLPDWSVAPNNRPVRPLPPRGAPVGGGGHGWGQGGRPGNPGLHLGNRGPDSVDLINHNIRHALPDKVEKQILKQLIAKNPYFISFQEKGDRSTKRMYKNVLNRHGYGLSGWNTRTGTPIAFKKGGRYKILEKGARKTFGGGFVGKGAGPDTLGPKFANYIVARDRKTGKERAIINMHASASQQNPLRNKLAKEQFRIAGGLSRDLEKKYGKDLARYIMGDMNTSKYGKLRSNGLGLNPFQPKGPTHSGGGRIDWFLSDAGLRNVGQFGTKSDHNALFANFGRGRPADRNLLKPGLGHGRRNPRYKQQNPNPPRRRV